MALYVSIVSHEHTDDILDGLQPHRLRAAGIQVVIKDNRPDTRLKAYCAHHNIQYLTNGDDQGFGHNHNDNYTYCRSQLGLKPDDWFIVLNPDVRVAPETLLDMVATMRSRQIRLAAPNLFKDTDHRIYEGSIRVFPYPWDFITSFLLKSRRTTVDRKAITEPTSVDWASGAFLAFRADLFERLGGFDERYFLYCEDIDICWRALHLEGEATYYLPDIKATHDGRRDSRKAANLYLLWHVTSAVRFSWVRMRTWLQGSKALVRAPF
ncbi:glycosyltransferase [Saccharospirillum salsuginis]|uniref:Rhamnosyltransferase WbbL n=1 Tax=Saccharospirillum salsuginis TaxID=418750 RepID=A0A918KE66_9GAMM|nr:glycosyltransferase family 2 protein [Saccharospirillum salsuginis]GGX60245.1 rhamnosyltransferase WbbL [Saccharospirillum salsuginis]